MTYESMESSGSDMDVFKPERDTVLVQVYEDQILPNGDVDVHLVLEGVKLADLGDAVTLPDAYEEKSTEFIYDFVITPAELKSKTVKQKLDVTVGVPGKENKNLTLKELTMNDLYCRIIAEGAAWDDDWPNQYELKLKGTDSFGNPVSLEGGRFLSENEMLFVTDFLGDYEAGVAIDDDEFQMSVPDKDCSYLDLQLYERKMAWEGEIEMLDEEEGIYGQESGETWKTYSEEENFGWEPVGEPFRITITHTGEVTDNENEKKPAGAADGNNTLMTLCELPESEEEIGNQIPQWVSDANQALPMHVMTSTDLEDFNDYAKKVFSSFYDDEWTKEQSDKVYLGQGIEMYRLDGSAGKLRIVNYPIVLNGVIVSVLEIHEDLHTHEMSWLAGPQLANQLNTLIQQMASYDTDTTLLLGYNNNNTIGIIGSFNGTDIGTLWKNYYILDIDHVEHKEVDPKLIHIKEATKGIVVDAIKPLCTERKVNWAEKQ